jgi:hypothetical protein
MEERLHHDFSYGQDSKKQVRGDLEPARIDAFDWGFDAADYFLSRILVERFKASSIINRTVKIQRLVWLNVDQNMVLRGLPRPLFVFESCF